MKQTKACKTRFKQPQNGIKLSPKPTPRSKRNKTKEKHRRERRLQRKNNMVSLGNEVNKRVSTLDMPQKGHLKCKD
jgi:hypothetical protein